MPRPFVVAIVSPSSFIVDQYVAGRWTTVRQGCVLIEYVSAIAAEKI
jgi:hypothetical protein